MNTSRFASLDYLNILLILVSCVVAHLFPYHLLIFSFAVLGPAHYLTQISWLHDRRYFANSWRLIPLLVLLAMGIAYTSLNGTWLLGAALVVAAISILPAHRYARLMAAILGLAWLSLLYTAPQIAVALGILLPTVIHIFIFTGAFMWAGARKTGHWAAYAACGVLCIAAASFLLPTTATPAPQLDGLAYFQSIVTYLQQIFALSPLHIQGLFGFLAFAYTYHYLNWFSKAEIIRWHAIPRTRMMVIALLYTLTLALYYYDYSVGFLFILFLSMLHVLLEFPLNLRIFASFVAPAPTSHAKIH